MGSSEPGSVAAPGNVANVADLLGFVTPGPFHPLWGDVVEPFYLWLSRYHEGYAIRPSPLEQLVFPGFATLFIALLGARCGGVRQRRLLIWVAIAFAVLCLGDFLHVAGLVFVGVEGETFRSLGLDRLLRGVGDSGPLVGIPLPHWLVSRMPGMSTARAPSRLIVLTLLAMVPFVAAGARILADRWGPRVMGGGDRGRALVLTLLGAVVLFEGAAFPMAQVDATYSPVLERIQRAEGEGAVLNLPPVPEGIYGTGTLCRYLYEQTVHGRPILSGFISRMPEYASRVFDEVPLLGALRDPRPGLLDGEGLSVDGRALVAGASAVIDSLGIDYVILHKELYFDVVEGEGAHYRLGAPAAYGMPARLLLEASLGAPCHEDEEVVVYASEGAARELPPGPVASGRP